MEGQLAIMFQMYITSGQKFLYGLVIFWYSQHFCVAKKNHFCSIHWSFIMLGIWGIQAWDFFIVVSFFLLNYKWVRFSGGPWMRIFPYLCRGPCEIIFLGTLIQTIYKVHNVRIDLKFITWPICLLKFSYPGSLSQSNTEYCHIRFMIQILRLVPSIDYFWSLTDASLHH